MQDPCFKTRVQTRKLQTEDDDGSSVYTARTLSNVSTSHTIIEESPGGVITAAAATATNTDTDTDIRKRRLRMMVL